MEFLAASVCSVLELSSLLLVNFYGNVVFAHDVKGIAGAAWLTQPLQTNRTSLTGWGMLAVFLQVSSVPTVQGTRRHCEMWKSELVSSLETGVLHFQCHPRPHTPTKNGKKIEQQNIYSR